MKILVIGDGHSAIHEVAVVNAFRKLGHKVDAFYWHSYFISINPVIRFWKRLQNKFLLGPVVKKINDDFVIKAIKSNPNLIFIYRGTHITAEAIDLVKKRIPGCKVFGYNNDDPFASGHPPWLWRHFFKSVPKYDLLFVYRHHNLNEFLDIGAVRVELLRSWYVPNLNYRIEINKADEFKYRSDVVFIGHYEDDGRLECLEEVVKNGFKLRIFGPGYEWNKILEKSSYLKHLAPVNLVWNDEYNKALSGAKIALCFFSKLNRDTYTRRCFEIPATETLLLSEYSDDLASLYLAGEEADFFKSKDEMIDKIKLYMGNNNLREAIAKKGRQRVVSDGHDINARMNMVVNYVY